MSDAPDDGLLGRNIRALDVSGDARAQVPDAVADIHQDRLDAIVLRQAFPAALRQTILGRLAADGELPWRRPNLKGPQADIRVLGVAATPTFETPGGPAVDAYFEDAARYTELYDRLLADPPGHADPIAEILATVSGGRPVDRLVASDGRAFAACTVRSLPEGQRIIVHHDGTHYQLPVYRDVAASLDTTTSLSFVALLQAPDAGGELVIHGLTSAEPAPRLPMGLPDGEAIKRDYRSHRIVLAAGDVLLFSAGRFFHHVAPVVGPTPRVTLGAFLTLDAAHRRVIYWN
jgi:hypothetical protein